MKKKRNSAAKQDEWQEVERPLYPGYVFIQCDPEELCEVESAIKGNCQGWLLKRGGETDPQPLTEEEIRKLEVVASEHVNKKPELSQFNLEVGKEVEMISGPFKGFKAIVKGLKKHMVQVEVSIFGRTTTVEVSIEQCVPINQ
jgi:transcription antitermination factor NusG